MAATSQKRSGTTDLTVGKPLFQILLFALPLVLGTLFQQLYSFADTVIVGRCLGTDALGAVGTTYSLNFLILGFVQGACVGFGIPAAETFGAKDKDGLQKYLLNGALLCLVLSVVFTVLTTLMAGPLLRLIHTPEELYTDAVLYIRLIFLGIPATVLYNYASSVLRALGDSRHPFYFLLVASVVNILLDYLFIVPLGMGVDGAAIATVAAQAVSVVCAVIMLLKKDLPFSIKKADFRLNFQCKKFLAIGLPLALQEFLTQLSFLALCAFVNRLGLEASSGYGVACKIVNFAMLVPSSLMQSMASFVSQNVGAGKPKRARKSMLTGIGVGLSVGCLVFILILLKGDVLAGFFSTDAGVIQKGFDYLKGFAPETLVTAVLFSMIGYFNGNNQTIWVMVQGLIQTLLVRLPMAYFMSIQPDASLTKIGLAAPTATVFGIILCSIYFVVLGRKEKI